ncbi:probable cysteine desulfurase [Amphiura filiformis]|uniref:probable cysteine desulfurase n=1 Tax=Amphiura filiformis TaxID=82378 RepID=UPI003B21A96C
MIRNQAHELPHARTEEDTKRALLRFVENNVAGKDAHFNGPFGPRRVVYCDYTASGRPLRFIENYIEQHVYPFYANTHTTTTITSRQTTQYRHEARDIIKECVNANEDDAVIFTGSGSTGAINKLVHAMEIRGEKAKNTVVLVGPFEHHSNILPWKETGAEVHRIGQTEHGLVDLHDLEAKLQVFCQTHQYIIGCFSAASNVTGILTDTHSVAALLHRYGALSFWDYATAAPYVEINMNPEISSSEWDCSKDAVFVSTHKFVGGVGTPGLLIAKKSLFINRVPGGVGGGTVHYVSRDMHHYVSDIEAREEGGTPAIVESIRAGLAFQIKQAIHPHYIEQREEELARRAFQRWQHNEDLMILGNREVQRLPIFSFLIRHGDSGRFLHHNFVAVLLNDLFGIQARGGCACAGPYAHDLLGITEVNATKFFELIREDRKTTHKKDPVEAVRPGFCRINLPYFASDSVIDYILDAIDMVATHGWKLLPQYRFDETTGAWTHRAGLKMKGAGFESLYDISYAQGFFEMKSDDQSLEHLNAPHNQLVGFLDEGRQLLDKVVETNTIFDAANDKPLTLENEFEGFVWFLEPRDAAAYLSAQYQATVAHYIQVETSPNVHSKDAEATVPTTWGAEDQYLDEDEAIVPDEVDEGFGYQSDVHMYGAAADAFSMLKAGGVKRASEFGQFDSQYDNNCYPCQETKFMRLDSGYGYEEEDLGVV